MLQANITHVLSSLRAFHAPNKLKDAILTYLTMQFSSLKETKELREIFLSIGKDGQQHGIGMYNYSNKKTKLFEKRKGRWEQENRVEWVRD